MMCLHSDKIIIGLKKCHLSMYSCCLFSANVDSNLDVIDYDQNAVT